MPKSPRLVYRIDGPSSTIGTLKNGFRTSRDGLARAKPVLPHASHHPATIFTMLLGAHESVAGGAWNAIARGREDGCEAVQIFARPSQQWRALPFGPDEV